MMPDHRHQDAEEDDSGSEEAEVATADAAGQAEEHEAEPREAREAHPRLRRVDGQRVAHAAGYQDGRRGSGIAGQRDTVSDGGRPFRVDAPFRVVVPDGGQRIEQVVLLEELVRRRAPRPYRAALERDQLNTHRQRHEHQSQQDRPVHAPPCARHLLAGEAPRARRRGGDDERPPGPVVDSPERQRAPRDDEKYQPGHNCPLLIRIVPGGGRGFSLDGPRAVEGTGPVHTKGRVSVCTNTRPW